ncbi:hypothetical protein WJX72_001465 [[Myrmecia] bisecta]|uniref:Uncharacterized protein n=1 Tax=[Myrmecia] bisecta TaxID=41462 RepID=A0AAW1P4K6_9CHLO
MASTATELANELPSTSAGQLETGGTGQSGGGPGSEGRKQAKIEPGFTQLVWQKLEEQNPDFFRAYYTRLKLKDQIVLFNHLLEQQVQMVQKMRTGWLQPLPGMMPRPGMLMATGMAVPGGPGAAIAGLPEPNFGIGPGGAQAVEHSGLPLFTNTGLSMAAPSSLAMGLAATSQAEASADLGDALQNLPISSVDLHGGFPDLSSPTRGGIGDPGDLLAFPRNFSMGDLERMGELGHGAEQDPALTSLLQQDTPTDLARTFSDMVPLDTELADEPLEQ